MNRRKWQRILRHKWGVIWRGALCWALGCFFLWNDEGINFDSRFQIRGDRPASEQIVLITLRPGDLYQESRTPRYFPDAAEALDVTDSFFWDPKLWTELMEKVLQQDPKKVGVTFFFNENLEPSFLAPSQMSLLLDPRIVWAAVANTTDRPSFPLLTSLDRKNIGSFDVVRDQDGIIRRFSPLHNEIPHLVERIAEKMVKGSQLINYKGSSQIYQRYTFAEVRNGLLPAGALKDKYVLIGPDNNSGTQYLTPLGSSDRAAVFAQVLENLVKDEWIKRAPLSVYLVLLFLVEILAIFLITQYPHSIAFVCLVWLGTLISALSIWVFDSFSIWIPVFSPLLLILTSWVIFIGYRANEVEQKNYLLKQEQKALEELEQLKNNFVSLISHDLKTPIAKIRAIVDRMLASHKNEEVREDLEKLRDFSDELNRYIQSILKVLRVESRDFRLHLEIGDINETIENVVEQVAPLASHKQIQLQLSLDPLFSIEGDFTLLREVILNLIENAIKYTPTGGIVQIRSMEAEESVIVEVIDNGPGIAPDDLNQIWGKFVRGKDQEMKTKGSGLGLYLVKFFVELHKGQVAMESHLGKGTKVSFRLPLEGILEAERPV